MAGVLGDARVRVLEVKLREAEPIGYERGAAFVTRSRGCGLEDVRTPVYNVSAPAGALRTARKVAGLGLRDAASVIGIRAVELGGLERGRLVPEDPLDWAEIIDKMIREAR